MDRPRYNIRVDVTITDNSMMGGQLRLSEEHGADIGSVDEAARLLAAVANVLKSATAKHG